MRLGWVRVMVFILFAALFFLALSKKNGALATGVAVGGVVSFALLVKKHNRLKEQLAYRQAQAEINQQEVDRLNGHYNNLNEGNECLTQDHAYAYDLDILGSHSVFQFLNRSSTHFGCKHVAQMLLNPPLFREIESRQKAIGELTGAVDWRQHFQAIGMVHPTQAHSELSMRGWLEQQDIFKRPWQRMLALIFATAFVVVATFVIAGQLSFQFLLLSFCINALLLLPYIKRINETGEKLISCIKVFSVLEEMSKAVRDQPWKSAKLSALQDELYADRLHAAAHMTRLRKLADYFDNRKNIFYQFLNGIFLLDIFLIYSVEKWRSAYGHKITEWMYVIAEMELICSLAGMAYANPLFAYPVFSVDNIALKAKKVGHPLILENERVSNDFEIRGRGSVALITGSNMAGKSTFLRTIGVNLVLAKLGAPVCASTFQFSPCRIFTSMRTKDNLNESISSFYAELLRIRTLLEQVDEGDPVLYLLDELLKGTNSKDRHKGAMALIRQLSHSNAFGLVSTHDLELGEMSEEIDRLANYNFESTIEGEEIRFDYKLRPGLCQNFNATRLMQKMGIEIRE